MKFQQLKFQKRISIQLYSRVGAVEGCRGRTQCEERCEDGEHMCSLLHYGLPDTTQQHHTHHGYSFHHLLLLLACKKALMSPTRLAASAAPGTSPSAEQPRRWAKFGLRLEHAAQEQLYYERYASSVFYDLCVPGPFTEHRHLGTPDVSRLTTFRGRILPCFVRFEWECTKRSSLYDRPTGDVHWVNGFSSHLIGDRISHPT